MKPPKLPPPCFDFLKAELIEAGSGKAVIRFSPTEEMENPYGLTQGGILAGMLDNIIGPAIVATVPGRRTTTVQMSVNYLRPVRTGDILIGTAEIIKHGKTQAYTEAKLVNEATGELVACCSAVNIFLD
jgi:acyl-coenzyme A thioesterase 13